MHRVELKDLYAEGFLLVSGRFLMHRVELKATLLRAGRENTCRFLMHRVELKVLWDAIHMVQVVRS